jgi:hypothetical protein
MYSTSSRHFVCKKDKDLFCYVCADFMFKKQRLVKCTPVIINIYNKIFGDPMVDLGKDFAPSRICQNCKYLLQSVANKNDASLLRFHIPAIWRTPKTHPTGCYFCSTNSTGLSQKQAKFIKYPELQACIRPQMVDSFVLPDLNDAVVSFQSSRMIDEDVEMGNNETDESVDDDDYSDFEQEFVEEFGDCDNSLNHPLYTTAEFNDFIRNSNVSKAGARIIGQTFKFKNAFAPGATYSHILTRDEPFRQFFKCQEKTVWCHDVE